MSTRETPYIPNVVVGLLLVLFFPIGLILVLVRYMKHQHHPHLRMLDHRFYGKFLLGLFWFFLFVGVVGFIGTQQDGTEAPGSVFGIAMVLLVFGWYLRSKAKRVEKQIEERYAQYRSLILERGMTSIVTIAGSVKTPLVVVTNELERMEYIGLLPNVIVERYAGTVRIDPSLRDEDEAFDWDDDPDGDIDDEEALRMLEELERELQIEAAPAAERSAKSRTPQQVECQSCGAPAMRRPGESKPCDYCGSAVRG